VCNIWFFKIAYNIWFFKIAYNIWFFKIAYTIWFFKKCTTFGSLKSVQHLVLWKCTSFGYFKKVYSIWFCEIICIAIHAFCYFHVYYERLIADWVIQDNLYIHHRWNKLLYTFLKESNTVHYFTKPNTVHFFKITKWCTLSKHQMLHTF
jgi:hypothetical protein